MSTNYQSNTSSLALSNEAELLLCCARLQPSSQQRDRAIQILAGELDWNRLLAIADKNGLSPLLFRNLQSVDRKSIPKQVFAQLWGRHQILQRRNKSMFDELAAILDLLESRGIAAIPYKGPALALEAYGDLALREFGDLDLLLRAGDIYLAKDALQAIGYRPEYSLKPAVEAAFLRSRANYHLVMVRDSPSVTVELHWKTDPEFPVEPLNDDAWWTRRPRRALGERKMYSFSSEELFLVLCLHGSKHFWGSLSWLVDVAELIRKQPELDWSWIIGRAEQLRAAQRLAFGLHLLAGLQDVSFSEPVQVWMAEQDAAKRLAIANIPPLFDPSASVPGVFRRLRLNFALYESRSQRLRHLADVVLNPTLVEWSSWPLPRALFFLYLPLRLGRLFQKHVLRSRAQP